MDGDRPGGLFAHGSWPDGVAFTGTPPALRSLATAPTDLAAAWPATPPDQLSGYGLFWGLLIGEAMILAVLAIFVLGTVARWRAVRSHRKTGTYGTPYGSPTRPPVYGRNDRTRYGTGPRRLPYGTTTAPTRRAPRPRPPRRSPPRRPPLRPSTPGNPPPPP